MTFMHGMNWAGARHVNKVYCLRMLTLKAQNLIIQIFTHLKLCLAMVTHNFQVGENCSYLFNFRPNMVKMVYDKFYFNIIYNFLSCVEKHVFCLKSS